MKGSGLSSVSLIKLVPLLLKGTSARAELRRAAGYLLAMSLDMMCLVFVSKVFLSVLALRMRVSSPLAMPVKVERGWEEKWRY